MLVEIVEFDQPNRLGSRTTSSMMTTSRFPDVHPCRRHLMAWDWEVQPKGWLRALGPLFGRWEPGWSAASGPG